jgi:hypothetical protein
MAVQMSVAHSATISGAGIIAAGPYWCAESDVAVALTACMNQSELIDVDVLVAATTYAETLASIDPTINLKSQRVWLFSGTQDTVVQSGVVRKLEQYYRNYVPGAQISTEYGISAEHALITDHYGRACSYLGDPFINNCNYDGAGTLLQWTQKSPLKSRVNATRSNVYIINQGAYTPFNLAPRDISLADTGYVYVPPACLNTECKLHISFHGCKQYADKVGTQYVVEGGFNEWAESNGYVVLYPQTVKSDSVPFNPEGCFDWWGYTGPEYATKLGPQLITFKNMIDALQIDPNNHL